MDIIAKLRSGELHREARKARPDCVDNLGNIHSTPERAAYVTWRNQNPDATREEIRRHYVAR